MAINPKFKNALILEKTCKLLGDIADACEYLDHCEVPIEEYVNRISGLFGVFAYAADMVCEEFSEFLEEYIDECGLARPLNSAENWAKTE